MYGFVMCPVLGKTPSSFAKLQSLKRCLEVAGQPGGVPASEQRAALDRIVDLGRTAIPLCVRCLVDSRDDVATWAYSLLLHLVKSCPETRPRVIEVVHELAEADSSPDNRKILALALLTELDAELPPIHLEDIGATRTRSLRDLASCLDSPAEVARAAHLLLTRLEESEIVELVEELVEAAPHRAEALIDELLVRDDVSERCRAELRQIRAPLLVDATRPGLAARPRRRPAQRSTFWLGRAANGSTVLVGARRRPGSHPVRHRALCCSITTEGEIADAMFRDDFTRRGVEREVVAPLEGHGYAFEKVEAEVARALLERAARATHTRGGHLPEAYYLGRDLFDLFDQHLPARTRHAVRCRLAPLLSRALDLMSAGQHTRAYPLLRRYVSEVEEDAEGWENLGLCALAEERTHEALCHLRRAVELDPLTSDHHWNLAAAAHRAGRQGGCYLALLSFLDSAAPADTERRAHARGLVSEYERLARVEYPRASATELARAEELCVRAEELRACGDVCQAAEHLERGLSLVPEHHPSWIQLALVRAADNRLMEAERCLERALEARPTSDDARRALAEVRTRRTREQRGVRSVSRGRGKRRRPRRGHTPQSRSVSR